MGKFKVSTADAKRAQREIEKGHAQLPSSAARENVEGPSGDHIAAETYQVIQRTAQDVNRYISAFEAQMQLTVEQHKKAVKMMIANNDTAANKSVDVSKTFDKRTVKSLGSNNKPRSSNLSVDAKVNGNGQHTDVANSWDKSN